MTATADPAPVRVAPTGRQRTRRPVRRRPRLVAAVAGTGSLALHLGALVLLALVGLTLHLGEGEVPARERSAFDDAVAVPLAPPAPRRHDGEDPEGRPLRPPEAGSANAWLLATDPAELPMGRPPAVADCEMGATGAFIAIGADSDVSGMFGAIAEPRAPAPFRRASGGATVSERTWIAGLRWLAARQLPDGAWPTRTDGPADALSTAAALEAFTHARRRDLWGERWQRPFVDGVRGLLALRDAEGRWGTDPLTHARCTAALLEASLVLTEDGARLIRVLGADPRLVVAEAADLLVAEALRDGTGGLLGWSADGATIDLQASLYATIVLHGTGRRGYPGLGGWVAPALAADPRGPATWDPDTGATTPAPDGQGLQWAAATAYVSGSDPALAMRLIARIAADSTLGPWRPHRQMWDARLAMTQVPVVGFHPWRALLAQRLRAQQIRTGDDAGAWPVDGMVPATSEACLALAALLAQP